MALTTIRLPAGQWSYDPVQPLGRPGGHAEVFLGSSADGNEIAVKRMKFDADVSARREIALAKELFGKRLINVLVPLDAGEDADRGGYYIVMPRASHSLADHVRAHGAQSTADTIAILSAIASGLQELPHLVHRDLKPENILWYSDRWCISDFGVAKLVSDATSEDTLFNALTAAYAAPEQWRFERATSASDLYALGCIAHFLVSTAPPFPTGTVDELRQRHLEAEPPPLSSESPQLRQLVSMLLRKLPDSRPSIQRTIALLASAQSATVSAPSAGVSRLSEVFAREEAAKAKAAAEKARKDAMNAQRHALALAGRQILADLVDSLFRKVESAGAGATRNHPHDLHWSLSIPGARLRVEIESVFYDPDEAFSQSHWDVVCGAHISVEQLSRKHIRSACLWYTRLNRKEGPYRWYETAYIAHPLSGKVAEFQPFAVYADDADIAHAPGIAHIAPAYPPVLADDEDADAFIERWLQILAAASESRLQTLSTGLL